MGTTLSRSGELGQALFVHQSIGRKRLHQISMRERLERPLWISKE